jgi:uncharacterized protein YndB with AHSA1/START domain
MSVEQNPTVRITRRFRAMPERVFDAWLTPEMIGQWMFGPRLRDEEVLHIDIDARVGGTFSFLVRRQGQEIDHIGEYLEIDRPHQLAFTWGIRDEPSSSQVTIDIARQGAEWELTLAHELDPAWADFADRTASAWNSMLTALAETIE